MNSVFIVVICFIIYFIGYKFYTAYLEKKVFPINKSDITPAHTLRDNIDYVPSNKYVLFGHHFASIAGLGPIVGPAIALFWGWLPAVIWVVVGAVFFGAVHDYAALRISLKYKAKSIGDITNDLINNRARLLFLIIIFFLLALAMGVFAYIIADLFIKISPESVVPVGALILIACVSGTLTFKHNIKLSTVTIIGLVLLAISIYLGMKFPFNKFDLHQWVYILLAYAFIASILPVWLLLQPRDYLNSFLLYAGFLILYAGLFIKHPILKLPAVANLHSNISLFPFLFITIACGAISGFHNLVSSGTSAKQINKVEDAKFIGYGSMIAESLLALVVIMACAAGLSNDSLAVYQTWALVKKGALKAFITGASNFATYAGFDFAFAKTFVALTIVSFAMTTLDSGTRLLRYNVEEISDIFKIKINRYVSSIIAVAAVGGIALLKIKTGINPATLKPIYKPAGLALWQLFGTTNQLLASLGLLIATVYLIKNKKPFYVSFIPFIIMLVITLWALILKIKSFIINEEIKLILLSFIILIMCLWLIIEALIVIVKSLKNKE